MDTPSSLEVFRAEHRQIEQHIGQCETVATELPALVTRLLKLRPLLLGHLDAKDAFYPHLRDVCAKNGDVAGANIATIFEDNMTVQSGAIRRFLAALDHAPSPLLTQSFTTMALIIRNRFSTEERAVFPLFLKNLKP